MTAQTPGLDLVREHEEKHQSNPQTANRRDHDSSQNQDLAYLASPARLGQLTFQVTVAVLAGEPATSSG
ncbi:hypothetical protein BHE90_004083 [Fusarium euwallaceae]|uniref:Uncharacterized protein n=1 Tax=Fusarium euwallaceae TaxID=1147111 RepID=A0A430M086_9HYPO|nr:hypothetical protein BHE90_004083 [Fusarium euwallaceae]